VAQSDEEAARWFKKSAAQGFATAQCRLGLLYVNGRVVAQSDEEAARWLKMSAAQGFSEAQCNIGVFYDSGRGLEQRDTEALKWYKLAADNGSDVAQCYLGNFYGSGRGVTKSEEEALRWYRCRNFTCCLLFILPLVPIAHVPLQRSSSCLQRHKAQPPGPLTKIKARRSAGARCSMLHASHGANWQFQGSHC